MSARGQDADHGLGTLVAGYHFGTVTDPSASALAWI